MTTAIGKQAGAVSDRASAVGHRVRVLARDGSRALMNNAKSRVLSRRRTRSRLVSSTRTAGLGALGGAAVAYLFDPDNGRRRRAIGRDRASAFVRRRIRRATDRAEVAAKRAHDHAVGAAHEARRTLATERSTPNDQELANRVRTEIFRPADAPKSSVSVNAEAGVVYLRGAVERPEQITELVAATKRVDGVRAVENLLHTPGQPAPTKQETEPETRRRVFGSRGR